MQKVLSVVAHPDDEVLGCGGALLKHIAAGDQVYILYGSSGVGARFDEKDDDKNIRLKQAQNVCEQMKVSGHRFLDLPDNRFDSCDLLDIVQAVGIYVDAIEPSIIYTHSGCDLNIDHQIMNRAVMTHCRPQPGFCVEQILSFETLSSTEWGISSDTPFRPNHYVDVTEMFDQKIKLMEIYDQEMRAFPHPRSPEAIEALAKNRGSQVGMHRAEAFFVERQLIRS